ncbi:MAG TPA: hypothetical protein VG942_00665 [Hyphomonadaceae bacterium]|nr:hypothetical protein [Hyphomonadaceae bacterium]
MRVFLLAGVLLAASVAISGCANIKTYQTQLDVCQGENGTAQSATVTKSSGDPAVDAYAVKQASSAMVYKADGNKPCHPLTVEYRSVGEKPA